MSQGKHRSAPLRGSPPQCDQQGGGGAGSAAFPAEVRAREQTPDAIAWWRALVRPIFFAMYDRGIGELRIKRVGTKVIFELTPEEPGPAGNE